MTEGAPSTSSLSGDLHAALDQCSKKLQLNQLLQHVSEKGFGILLVILSLPSALPVPAAGYSVPFGIILVFLSLQMISGRKIPYTPSWMGKRAISKEIASKMVNAAEWFLGKTEWLIRPRMQWINSRGGRLFMGILTLFMAILMLFPIPLTNTAPAMVIFLIGVGLSEKDGLFAIMACIAGSLAVCLYSAVIYFFYHFISTYGWDAIDQFKDWLLNSVF
jgi:hypothetical protein